ncbi:hypothetical protein D3C71_1743100 [compost metagenome]
MIIGNCAAAVFIKDSAAPNFGRSENFFTEAPILANLIDLTACLSWLQIAFITPIPPPPLLIIWPKSNPNEEKEEVTPKRIWTDTPTKT